MVRSEIIHIIGKYVDYYRPAFMLRNHIYGPHHTPTTSPSSSEQEEEEEEEDDDESNVLDVDDV